MGGRDVGKGSAVRRTVVISTAVVVVLVAAVAWWFVDRGALARGQSTWRTERPAAYSMTVTVDCFCPLRGTWQLDVDGDQVDAEPPEDQPVETDPPTIDLLYRQALATQTLMARTATSIDDRGVPHRVHVEEWGRDDGQFGWTIDRFDAG